MKLVYCVSKKVDKSITLIYLIDEAWCRPWFRNNRIVNSIYIICKQEVIILLSLHKKEYYI